MPDPQAIRFAGRDYLLVRRLQDYARQGRFAAATSAFGAFVAFLTQFDRVAVIALVTWFVGMLAVSGARYAQARKFDAGSGDIAYFRRQHHLVLALSLLDCAGWSAGLVVFSSLASGQESYFLAALVTGVLAASLFYYRSLPVISGVFVLAIAGAGAWVSYELTDEALLMSLGIIIVYVLVLLRGILVDARYYDEKVSDEAALSESADTIKLLLHDFEAQSSDWLWQIDANGSLEEVCDRFAEAAGLPVEKLEGLSFASIFEPGTQRELFAHRLLVRQPFRDLTLKLTRDGEPRWWTLSANRADDGSMRGVARDTTDTRQAVERVNYMAHHDTLTGIANRFLFGETLEDILGRLQEGERLGLLYLDLDHFKTINDTHGHSTGDLLLQEAAKRIKASVKEHDLVARLGGDEFAVLLSRVNRDEDATGIAQRIIDAVGRPFLIEGQKLTVGTSVGVADFEGPGGQADELLRRADLALYAAKALGRNCFHEFEPWLEERDRQRAELEADLREAIKHGQFTLHYQPLYHIQKRVTVGFETLVRWDHPEMGVVMPGEFIPLAEDSGLIVPLGEWIIRQAIAEAATWKKKEAVAINLSPLQMRSARLIPTLTSAIETSGIDPNRIELEITENMLMQDSERNLAMLHRFRDMGMRISLDDFGTGYSSLNYLQSFPFNKIKIDKCFVENLETRDDAKAIIRAVMQLAQVLDMDTVAEGVERASQLEWLRNEGVKQVQGYLISYPVNTEELSDGRPFDEKTHSWYKPPAKRLDSAA